MLADYFCKNFDKVERSESTKTFTLSRQEIGSKPQQVVTFRQWSNDAFMGFKKTVLRNPACFLVLDMAQEPWEREIEPLKTQT